MVTTIVICFLFVGALLSYGARRYPSHARVMEAFAGAMLLGAFIAIGFCLR